jgi:hypothetical protein
MRARATIATVLASGLLMSGGGAALALSGDSSSGNVGAAGYAQPQVLGETQATEPTVTEVTPSVDDPEAKPEVQGTRQVASSDVKSLPFTGLAAVPIILAGLVMLGAGALLRRRLLTD